MPAFDSRPALSILQVARPRARTGANAPNEPDFFYKEGRGLERPLHQVIDAGSAPIWKHGRIWSV